MHKVEEISYTLKDLPLDIKPLNLKGVEIQAETVAEIASSSALQASKKNGIPLIVEDTGLFISALNGFPGPYASYVQVTLGIGGILKLLDRITDRKAIFQSVVAFSNTIGNVKCFLGESQGVISYAERGSRGFGFDSIFEPCNGAGKTFAEMELEEKTKISHRSLAVKQFANWYLDHFTMT